MSNSCSWGTADIYNERLYPRPKRPRVNTPWAALVRPCDALFLPWMPATLYCSALGKPRAALVCRLVKSGIGFLAFPGNGHDPSALGDATPDPCPLCGSRRIGRPDAFSESDVTLSSVMSFYAPPDSPRMPRLLHVGDKMVSHHDKGNVRGRAPHAPLPKTPQDAPAPGPQGTVRASRFRGMGDPTCGCGS